MAGKPNIRSIRFSDELAELIDRQVGNTFTEKFEGLITRCVWELPKKEAELKRLEKEIQEGRERIVELWDQRRKLEQIMRNIQQSLDQKLKDLEKL